MKRRTSKSSIKDWEIIFDSAKDSIMLLDLNFVIKEANRSTFYFLNKSVEEIIGKQCFRLVHGSDKPPKECPVLIIKQTKKHEEAELYLSEKDIWIWVTATPIFDENGRMTYIEHVIRDITEHKRAERELEDLQEKYRSLVESIDDSIYLVDRNYKCLFINKKHIKRMGLSEDVDYIGQDYSKFHSSEQTGWLIKKANIVFNTGKSIQHEYKSDRDGRYFHYTLSPVEQSDGKIQAITVVSRDITDYKKMEGKLRTLSLSDELTSLYNRRGFFALGNQVLKISMRTKKGLFLLYADVDNLKAINDAYGHREGDMVLVEIAHILKENFRESDIIARIGGDEFVVFPVGSKGDNTEVITTRLKKCIEIHNAKVKRRYNVSISVGLSYYDPLNPCSIDELLARGDQSMYEQKNIKGK
jgi:diguanylate cyclase (GGDEF)-like protein/PAS domain S-box-containing protein